MAAMTETPPHARFWDRIADRYARRPVADQAAYQTKLEITQSHFTRDMDVLEFGCGTGTTALIHAPFVRHVQAIDVSAKMIDIARNKAEAEGTDNVTFARAGIEEFDAPDGSFDAVLGMSILHLLDDRQAAIAKVHRMLKPGGVFVSSTVCLGDNLKIFKLIAPVGRFLRLLPILKVFTVEELIADLRAGGFEIQHRWQPGKNKGVFVVAKKSR